MVTLISLPVQAELDAKAIRTYKGRFVLELDQKVNFRVKLNNNGTQAVLSLPKLKWDIQYKRRRNKSGLISGWRYFPKYVQQSTSAIFIYLRENAEVKKIFFLTPNEQNAYRLVIDFTQSRQESNRFPIPGRKPFTRDIKIIVLDPGHGGVDPGAVTNSGVYEKDVALSVARIFKKRIEHTGEYKVFLTRNKDVYIKLRKRFETARKYGADLFISLHADANNKRNLRGISLYTLGEKASSVEAAALAKRENLSDIIQDIDDTLSPVVKDILIDLAQRSSKNDSIVFAKLLLKRLGGVGKLMSKPLRQADLAVLKSPSIPSVLVELGYMTNAKDLKSLKSSKYKIKLGDATYRAINEYFDKVNMANPK